MGLVRRAVRHYCLGGCSALVVCARRSRPVRGAPAGVWCCVFPVSPFPDRVSCAVCGGPSRPGVPYPPSLVRHSMRSVQYAGSVRLPFWFSPRVPCVCVRLCSRGVRAPPPPPLVGLAHAPRAVPVLGAGRAVSCSPCPSACPSPVPCSVWFVLGGGGSPVSFPPYLAWGCVLPDGRVCSSGASLTYEDLSVLLLELALEKESDQHLNAYRAGGGNSVNHGRGHQAPGPEQGTTHKNARYMSNVQDLFWCDAIDEQGGLVHAPD